MSHTPSLLAVLPLSKARNAIFRCLSPGDVAHIARACKGTNDAAVQFLRDAYDINKHLSFFFNDPLAFRSLQAKTGTLVSGSNALQFLERDFYPGSDLDIYTHPGYAKKLGRHLISKEGYIFNPKATHPRQPFSAVTGSTREPWKNYFPNSFRTYDEDLVGEYNAGGIEDVHHFERRTTPNGPVLRIQIIACQHSPLHCILNFHSTCVMNFIAYDAVYSIYPYWTFVDYNNLVLRSDSIKENNAIAKYSIRGWEPVDFDFFPIGSATPSLPIHVSRHVGDRFTWRFSLDLTGIHLHHRLSPASRRFTWDPVIYNSWMLCIDPITSKLYHFFRIVHTAVYRYTYLCTEGDMHNVMQVWGNKDRKKQWQDAQENKICLDHNSWKWGDRTIPAIQESLRRFKAEKQRQLDNAGDDAS